MTTQRNPSANAGRDASGVRRVRGRSRGQVLAITLAAAAVVVAIDLVSKHWAETTLPLLEQRPALGGILHFRLLYNSGAAWGLGAGITPVVTVVQMLICLGALAFVLRSIRSSAWALALGLVIGGALGNIHDRLLRAPGPFRGEVVDFLELPHWPVFNVADMAVCTGAVLIVLLGLLGRPADPGLA